MTSTDDDSGFQVFGRPVEDIPAGGGVGGDLKRALAYPFTMTLETFLKGGALTLASIFALPVPLLWGYAIDGTRRSSRDQPLPGFGDWGQQYRGGLRFILGLAVLLFGQLLGVAFAEALVGTGGSEALAVLLVLFWLYAAPWVIGVYGMGSWHEFDHRRAWRWLVSPNYVATWIVLSVVLFVAYFLVTFSAITVVGPIFFGFYFVVVHWVLLGERYATYLESVDVDDLRITDRNLLATARRTLEDLPVEEWRRRLESASSDLEPAGTGDAGQGADNIGERADAAGTQTGSTARQTDVRQNEYGLLRERADPIDVSGPIHRLSAEDGNVRYLSLGEDAQTEASVEAFQTVVGRWENLSSTPQVATVLGSDDEPTTWVAFEPSDGSLAQVGGDLSQAGVVAVLEDIEEAIATGRIYNLAHGELTPNSVYVERRGGTAPAHERISATVSDWGIERMVRQALGEEDLESRYLAPEQRAGGPPDRSVDVYQVAAVTHYALFGEPPHVDVPDDRLTDPDDAISWSPPDGCYVSEDTVAAFERALAPDPDERYESTSDFVNAVRNAIE